jgi:hypothetical protein
VRYLLPSNPEYLEQQTRRTVIAQFNSGFDSFFPSWVEAVCLEPYYPTEPWIGKIRRRDDVVTSKNSDIGPDVVGAESFCCIQ